MSYWNEHEKVRGQYDFTELDWQFDLAEAHGAEVTLCLGLRQPRWPESHWPDWARELPEHDWHQALFDFIAVVVKRYQGRKCVVSYQLENEALLKAFGLNGDFNRDRLKAEFRLTRSLDQTRPIIMTTSDSGGFPFFGPKPDAYASTIYRYFFRRNKYRHSIRPAWTYWLRAQVFLLFKWRRTFIHELQAEPWGPVATAQMSVEEQFVSMNLERVKANVVYGRATHLYPLDMWGMEWWYWLKIEHDHTDIWEYMRSVYKNS